MPSRKPAARKAPTRTASVRKAPARKTAGRTAPAKPKARSEAAARPSAKAAPAKRPALPARGPARPSRRVMPEAEREGRLKLAAAYRAFVHFGWDELTANHLTLRLPGEQPSFLINPYGLLFSEITAGNLVRVDLAGNVLDRSAFPINPAGLNIHTAIHMGREDARCVMHAHTVAGMAVSCMDEGLMFLCLEATDFFGHVGYHDFEGPAVLAGERPRLQRDLGANSALILRNHGVLTVGESVDQAFLRMYRLLLSCQVQVAALATQRPLMQPSAAVLAASAERHDRFFRLGPYGREVPWGTLDFAAVMRLMDRVAPDYRDI